MEIKVEDLKDFIGEKILKSFVAGEVGIRIAEDSPYCTVCTVYSIPDGSTLMRSLIDAKRILINKRLVD